VPSVCTCIRALLGSRLDGDTRVGHVPVSFPSDYSLGSLIRVHCVECLLYERHAISAQSARIGGTCSARKSRLAGGGLAGSGKRTTCDDHGDVKAISSLGLCCGLWFARALLVERTHGSSGGAGWNLQGARCFRPVGKCPYLPPRTTTLVLLIRFHCAGCFLAEGRAIGARAC
jgi:hypothetical protein